MMTFLKIVSNAWGCSTWRFAPLHDARVLLLHEAFLLLVYSSAVLKIQLINCTGGIIAFFPREIHAAAAK
jgi:hypothetical protein